MGLSQTATVLVAVFAFCLVAVTIQLTYVLWWKRRFLRRSVTGSELDTFSSRGGDQTATPPPSKELLYFFLFCLENKQFRIGSATAPPLTPAAPPVNDVASKWSMGENRLLGPSETLFTIAEDCASDTDHRTVEIQPRESISLEDQVKDDDKVEDDFVVVTDRNDDEVDYSEYDHDSTTPFSTPCASPPFYTPSPSPIRDDLSKTRVEESF